jgi:hypothetical protein
MTKGICDLREFLRKGIMRLTKGWLLHINDLATSCKCAVYQQVRRLLFANTPPNRFRGATFLWELT